MTTEKGNETYKVPSWAGKPPQGSHLDVQKDERVIQKLLIDEKGSYYFGRNPNQCDFTIEHASASRVHAVLLYHKVLSKFSIVDLESSHGTFVRNVKISPLHPVFLDYNDSFRFGASSRSYIIREKVLPYTEEQDAPLPESEIEVDNLTSYNTMQNKRLPAIPCTVEECRKKKRPRNKVVFLAEEDVINPEDVDPTVGRFRNLIQTAVISNKRPMKDQTSLAPTKKRIVQPARDSADLNLSSSVLGDLSISSAPSLDAYSMKPSSITSNVSSSSYKKKYAKEAWPGRKPA
ncbi:unnamed protein product [Bursaphelenchus xylophilus]|uniref:(pine wood nematode) hypothetical protein n=1 Tax=Bursaphelenchus xylophilus TaxID=6326 RepID=A0A1I7S7A8_BURXY|nr:unnamed protein product [Bursaphelenchus xylophilus]CAG9084836.1 unnamed protein product [Bursaphelenchus xylophilus]